MLKLILVIIGVILGWGWGLLTSKLAEHFSLHWTVGGAILFAGGLAIGWGLSHMKDL